MGDVTETRRELMSRPFPEGIPRLWCPLLTHYDDAVRINFDRMSAHLGHIGRWVKGYLVPGTTGDGWELRDDEEEQLLRFAIVRAQKDGLALLAGVLKPDAASMLKQIDRIAALASAITGKKRKPNTLRPPASPLSQSARLRATRSLRMILRPDSPQSSIRVCLPPFTSSRR